MSDSDSDFDYFLTLPERKPHSPYYHCGILACNTICITIILSLAIDIPLSKYVITPECGNSTRCSDKINDIWWMVAAACFIFSSIVSYAAFKYRDNGYYSKIIGAVSCTIVIVIICTSIAFTIYEEI